MKLAALTVDAVEAAMEKETARLEEAAALEAVNMVGCMALVAGSLVEAEVAPAAKMGGATLQRTCRNQALVESCN